MARIVVGGVVGGVVLFFWGFVAHMLLPLGELGLKSIPSEEDVAGAIRKEVREPGLYMLPGRDMSRPQSESEQEAHMAKVAKGPYGFMVLYPSGREFSMGKHLPIELATNVACALLAAIVVSQLRPGFLVRAGCVTLFGVLGSIAVLVPYWNWYGYPTDYTLAQIAEHTIGWLLAGITLAIIVRPPAKATVAE